MADTYPPFPHPLVPRRHIPARPSWDCACCGEEWPCDASKKQLTYDYRRNRNLMFVHLGDLAVQAAGDLPAEVNVVQRIVSWARSPLPPMPEYVVREQAASPTRGRRG